MQKMEYHCHIRAGDAQSSFSSYDRVQKRLFSFMGNELFSSIPPLSHRLNNASVSLLDHYFSWQIFRKLYSLVVPVYTLTAIPSYSIGMEEVPLSVSRELLHCETDNREDTPSILTSSSKVNRSLSYVFP